MQFTEVGELPRIRKAQRTVAGRMEEPGRRFSEEFMKGRPIRSRRSKLPPADQGGLTFDQILEGHHSGEDFYGRVISQEDLIPAADHLRPVQKTS